MSTDGGRWIHRGNNLDSLQINELQVIIIETLVTDDLLQEGDQLNGVIFVRFREIDVLQVKNQALTVLGSVHSAL
jgi:hypothetical protein